MSNAVSFSRWNLYRNCPASYEWQYVLGNKRPFDPTGPAARGTRIHNSIESAYLEGDDGLLDDEIPLKMKQHVLSHWECTDVRPEMEFCLNDKWEVLDDFEHEDGFVRGFMDNVFVYPDKLVVHEYKTGREYDEHADQKALYGMVCLSIFPEYDSVTVEGVYLDSKKVKPTNYTRTMLMSMQFHWAREIKKLQIPIYPARPGMHCRWCPKSHKQGGPCQLG